MGFRTIQLVVYDNYPPFKLHSFKLAFTKDIFEETQRICKQISTIFAKNVSDTKINHNQDADDKQLIWSKAIDFENQYPILMSLIDTFGRWCADENRKHWIE